jgi:hypothetical protein
MLVREDEPVLTPYLGYSIHILFHISLDCVPDSLKAILGDGRKFVVPEGSAAGRSRGETEVGGGHI